MAKQWKCSSCGSYERKGAFATLRGEPQECTNCGGSEFDSAIVSGPVDTVLDRLA